MNLLTQSLKWLSCHYIQLGDTLPSVEVQEGNPKTKVNVKDLFAGKKGVLFAVPGAFTPGCSNVGNHRLGIMNNR